MRYLLIGLVGFLTLGIVFSCQKETSIEYGTAATGSLQSSAGDCLPKTLGGSYTVAKALNDSNYIDVTVNVTATGPYKIVTDTVNGYAFKASGSFSNTGANTVRLKGSGTPVVAGTDDFTVFFDSSYCGISVLVSGGSSGSGCGTTNVQGTYTASTALNASNSITFSHTYAAAGSYVVKTNTVNGYSFGPSTYTATAGANTITLTATGTPTAAGTNSFNIDFGDGQTCSFSVTVGSGVVNTDYFPTTLNSYWTYDDGNSADTFKMTVTGPITIGSNTYQKFTYTGYYIGDEYYRKDATTGFYYQSIDTAGLALGSQGILFNQPQFDLLFLKNGLTTGASWNSDVSITYNGAPSTLRFKFTCVDANASKTVNGKNFTNVYQIQEVPSIVGLGDVGGPFTNYYAKGVGLISTEDETGTPTQNIRYWQIF